MSALSPSLVQSKWQGRRDVIRSWEETRAGQEELEQHQEHFMKSDAKIKKAAAVTDLQGTITAVLGEQSAGKRVEEKLPRDRALPMKSHRTPPGRN